VLRVFLAFIFIFLNLQASCRGGYNSCKQKIIDSKSIKKSTLQIPLEKHQRVVFSTTTPHAKILKYDPFLSLYLIEDKKGFRYPFRINMRIPLGLAVVDNKMAIEGKVLQKQIGLNSFATFSEPLFYPSILTNSCCTLEGIVTPQGIIQKEYIKRFLKVKKVEYGDIGVRVEQYKRCIRVKAYNPFIKNNPFRVGDCILKLDTKKVKDASSFMQKILFSKIGLFHKVEIKRASKLLTFKVKTKKRRGGGYLSDTFLEFLGISFDKNLHIVSIQKKAEKYQLKLGDKLVQVNSKNVTNEEDILNNISQNKKQTYLLFERDGFEFFIRVGSIQ